MSSMICRWSLAFLALTLSPASPAHAQTPGPEAFGTLPAIAHPAISADGNLLAWGMAGAEGATDVRILNVAANSAALSSLGDYKLRGLTFEETGIVLVDVGQTLTGPSGAFETRNTVALNPVTGESRLLQTGGESQRTSGPLTLVSIAPDDPGAAVLSGADPASRGRTPAHSLFRVELATGKVQRIERGEPTTVQFAVDRAGRAIARVDFDPATGVSTLLARGREGAAFRPVQSAQGPSRAYRLIGLTATGQIAFQREGPEWSVIEGLNPDTGAISAIARAEDVQIEGAGIDPWSQQMAFVRLGGLTPDVRWLNPDRAALQARLEARYPDRVVNLIAQNRDGSATVFRTEGTDRPPVYLLHSAATDRVRNLGMAWPALATARFGAQRALTIEARDGRAIPVYLTMPPGRETAKGLPAVVLLHAGPGHRDRPRFDWWAQYLATRGYAVIQPQHRGSTGFGRSHESAGRGQWGRAVQDDIADTIAWATSAGPAAAGQVCVVGASHGGYAALAAAALHPALVRCAVAVGAPTDLALVLAPERGGRRAERTTARGLGGPAANEAKCELTGATEVARQRQASVDGRHAGTVHAPESYACFDGSQGEAGSRSFLTLASADTAGDERIGNGQSWPRDIGLAANDPLVAALSPVRLAGKISAPVLLVHGTADTVVDPRHARDMDAALRRAGQSSRLVMLEGEDHWLSTTTGRTTMLREIEAFLYQALPRG